MSIAGRICAAALAVAISSVATPSFAAERQSLPAEAMLLYYRAFPAAIPWGSHIAFAKCPAAIASPALWPKAPGEACAAMQMCANEAQLSDAEDKRLLAAIRQMPGCQDP